MNSVDFGSERWGWYAYAENGILVIGESFPHEGGDLYSGDYKGEDTPYLMKIKKDCPKIYNRIVKYFEVDMKNGGGFKRLSDMERLERVFADCDYRNLEYKNMNKKLYWAVCAVVSEERRKDAINYFKTTAREYL